METLSNLLPTDNLYKFLSLSGLFICLFCWFYPEWRTHELYKRVIQITAQVNVVSSDLVALNEESREVTERLKNYSKDDSLRRIAYKNYSGALKIYNWRKLSYYDIDKIINNPTDRKNLEFLIKYQENLFPEIKELENIMVDNTMINKLNHQIELKNIKLTSLGRESELDLERAKHINIMGFFGFVIGFFMSIIGFRFWYLRHQKLSDILLQKQVEEIQEKRIINKQLTPTGRYIFVPNKNKADPKL